MKKTLPLQFPCTGNRNAGFTPQDAIKGEVTFVSCIRACPATLSFHFRRPGNPARRERFGAERSKSWEFVARESLLRDHFESPGA